MTYDEYINAFNGARQAVHLFGSDRISYDPTPTGFNALDKYALNGGLYEGLYILGAKPSLGKTTFVMQIADQVAKSGNTDSIPPFPETSSSQDARKIKL